MYIYKISLYYMGLPYFIFTLSIYTWGTAGRSGRGFAFSEFSMLFIIFGHMGILGAWMGIWAPPTQSTRFYTFYFKINDLSFLQPTQTPPVTLPKTGRFTKNPPFGIDSPVCGNICDRNSLGVKQNASSNR